MEQIYQLAGFGCNGLPRKLNSLLLALITPFQEPGQFRNMLRGAQFYKFRVRLDSELQIDALVVSHFQQLGIALVFTKSTEQSASNFRRQVGVTEVGGEKLSP